MTGPQPATSLGAMLLRCNEQLKFYRTRVDELEANRVHILAVIAFGKNGALHADRRSTLRTSVAGQFDRGEIYALCRQALKDSKVDLSTRDLADACMGAKGIDPSQTGQRGAMMQRVTEVLSIHASKGEIFSPMKVGKLKLWRLK